MLLITHQAAKVFKVSELSEDLFVELAALLLQVLDVLVGGWSVERSERCFNILANFVDQVNVDCEVAVLHDLGDVLGLEVELISDQIERLGVLKSRDIV